MTEKEFSYKFDVFYNNITSNQAPGLNEWEKSLFLTKAQEEIVKNYFNPRSNVKQEGFDDSPKRQADFSTIIRNEKLDNVLIDSSNDPRFDKRSVLYKLPSDLFISLNEQIIDDGIIHTVVPISFEEYNRLMKKPYKYPPRYMTWKLITGVVEGNPLVEMIGNFTESIPAYKIRYVKKLQPIILCNLNEIEEGLRMNNLPGPITSELPEELHEEILQRAVELAKATWATTGQDNTNLAIEMGKRSE